MNMKRLLTLLMALAMTASLAACGGSTDTEDGTSSERLRLCPPAWRTAC